MKLDSAKDQIFFFEARLTNPTLILERAPEELPGNAARHPLVASAMETTVIRLGSINERKRGRPRDVKVLNDGRGISTEGLGVHYDPHDLHFGVGGERAYRQKIAACSGEFDLEISGDIREQEPTHIGVKILDVAHCIILVRAHVFAYAFPQIKRSFLSLAYNTVPPLQGNFDEISGRLRERTEQLDVSPNEYLFVERD